MSRAVSQSAVRGGLAALACYLVWGAFPVYWHLLATVDAVELIAHRLFWTMVVIVPVQWWRDGLESVYAAFNSGRIVLHHVLSGSLLTINWLVFVWAVNNGHVLESSLGYFLVPLVNVTLGWRVLGEHLRPAQWLAIAFAAAGVGWQLWSLDRLPWIALALAGTFGTYGLLRKRATLGSLPGLTVETLLMAPLAGAYLLWCTHRGTGALGFAPAGTQLTVLTTGVVTAVPLLWFAYGARRLRFTTLGLLQYVAPTGQFALGLWYFAEPFNAARAQSFGLIWFGLALYTTDALRHRPGALTRDPPPAVAS